MINDEDGQTKLFFAQKLVLCWARTDVKYNTFVELCSCKLPVFAGKRDERKQFIHGGVWSVNEGLFAGPALDQLVLSLAGPGNKQNDCMHILIIIQQEYLLILIPLIMKN